ncbi:HEAT repeat domain-containing protein [Catenuloplanes japonicus]|uniref:HEAT repeat domain-containing protein n=1 Tax=Catenuloplanes japonicus TaxID=33876 RepID=UPI00068CA998|nr:HEAT repeat domain-containing protein [Catenuloplanes japonicus]
MGLSEMLSSGNSSVRLKAALAVGTRAHAGVADVLVARCAVEPDFFVRDMLTWALTRLPQDVTVPRLLTELRSPVAQARSQALHTLSKIGDPETWPAITPALLHDADDEVARTAWRTAVALVPADEAQALAGELAAEFGRGERDVWRSLSRSLVTLGDEAEPAIALATTHPDPAVRAHARATARLLHDPEAAFTVTVEEEARSGVPRHDDREEERADR